MAEESRNTGTSATLFVVRKKEPYKMSHSKTHYLLTLIIYALTLFMLLDTFVFTKSQLNEVLNFGRTEISRTGVSRSYTSYILKAKSNREYLVPLTLFNTLSTDENFVVHRTALLKKPVTISWCRESNCYSQDIGTLNGNWISYGAIAYLLILPLIVIHGQNKISISKRNSMIYLATGIAFGTFIFYLVY